MGHIASLEISAEHVHLVRHIEAISRYKGKLDAALVAKKRKMATKEQEVWLQSEGFTRTSPIGTGVDAETFAQWVFGPFTRWRNADEPERILTFPSYYAIGWNRRQYAPVGKARALEIKCLLDIDSCDPDVGDGYVRWLKPLPVIIAGEGKHRVDLFREHGLEMIAKVSPTPMPSASDLELWRIWGTDDVWALRCKNADFLGRDQSKFAPLPLPDLSVPLLMDYGVPIRQLRCFPWRIQSRVLDAAGWALKSRPRCWRSALLNAGYI